MTNEEIVRRLIPQTVDAAIVALGTEVEALVLVTNYLKKIGVSRIVARAESNEHGEILELVGARELFFPTREAAKRITPLLVSSDLFNYLPISNGLVIAEVKVPRYLEGLSLIEADLRKKYSINVIAIRNEELGDFDFVSPEYHFQAGDVLLLAEKNVS